MLPNRSFPRLTYFFIYGLAFLLLTEWLHPLPYFTATFNVTVFIWFSLFCFIFMFLRLPFYLTSFLVGIMTVYGTYSVYVDGSFLKEWYMAFPSFVRIIKNHVPLLLTFDLRSYSFEFQTILLFFFLALMSFFIHYWLSRDKKLFFFIGITIVYVTIIDTFSPYDASAAIIRIILSSAILLFLLAKIRLETEEKVQLTSSGRIVWFSSLFIFIVGAMVIAYFLPKYDPIWPDPIPTIMRVATGDEQFMNAMMNRSIGYGNNDARLGGGFINDETVVFTAISKRPHYWRGESREIYTGKGWRSIEYVANEPFTYSEKYDRMTSVSFYENSVPRNQYEVTVQMEDDFRYWHFFYPGQLMGIDEATLSFFEKEKRGLRYFIDYVGGKIGTVYTDNYEPAYLQEFKLEYEYPQFVIEHLKRSDRYTVPIGIEERYLQLPAELPNRVKELAGEITSQYETRFEKAKAVEGYFKQNGYVYATTNVPIPNEDEDYVDQFLFETKRGYCDNYSTSMVVMLRAIGIPARWVKGFTAGEIIEHLGNGYKRYEIRNSNAHSWVEVYFPSVGWVPFEPTSGFNQTVDFVEEAVEVTAQVRDEFDEYTQEEAAEKLQQNQATPLFEKGESVSGQGEEESSSNGLVISLNMSLLLLSILCFCVLVVLKWKRLVTVSFVLLYKNRRNSLKFDRVYNRLLWLLQFHGLPMLAGETLREYATRIDGQFLTDAMKNLTDDYEQLFYGKGHSGQCNATHLKKWELLVKKMSS